MFQAQSNWHLHQMLAQKRAPLCVCVLAITRLCAVYEVLKSPCANFKAFKPDFQIEPTSILPAAKPAGQ